MRISTVTINSPPQYKKKTYRRLARKKKKGKICSTFAACLLYKARIYRYKYCITCNIICTRCWLTYSFIPRCLHHLSHNTGAKITNILVSYIQDVSRLVDITAGGEFLGLCDQKKSSYKHVSDFGRLRSYDRLKLRIEGNDY